MNDLMHDDRMLTKLDHIRVSRLVSGGHDPILHAGERMQEILDGSQIVPSPAVPASVITMNSHVLLEDEQAGKRFELVLCYPQEANASLGKISVLSPAGAALLGLQEGAVAHWQGPAGDRRGARVVSILYQPEAAGDYVT